MKGKTIVLEVSEGASSLGEVQSFRFFSEGDFSKSTLVEAQSASPVLHSLPEGAQEYVEKFRQASIGALRNACSKYGLPVEGHREDLIFELASRIFRDKQNKNNKGGKA